MTAENDTERRLQSEREFHDTRFAEETRTSVHGFYRTIAHCFDEYHGVVAKLGRGKRVLEYGCGKGQNALRIAQDCVSVHGIDISDVAIDSARTEARARGILNAKFDVMNAEELKFEDATFDVIFGSGIIHHLDVSRAYSELARVLRPEGSAVFVEPLGHNPLIRVFRNMTLEMRTPDEHPLLKSDYVLARKYFDRIDLTLYGLAALTAIPLLKTRFAGSVISAGRMVDRVLLRLPGIKWWAWYSLIILKKA
jgi:ubiquinone/menaquinone biosynthesis C-methylase UbiE